VPYVGQENLTDDNVYRLVLVTKGNGRVT